MFSINYAIICTIRKETVLGEQGPYVHGTFSLMVTFQRTSDSSQLIKSFSSSRNSHFQNEVKRKTFLVKMSFICMRIDLIHDTRHFFTRSTDGMKEKSRGFSRT